MTEAQRKKAYRRRQAAGLTALRIWTRQYELAEAMLAAGRLTPAQCLSRAEVERAVGEIINDWAQRWRQADH